MSDAFLPTLYQNFIHVSRYARWVEDEKRRETWGETVNRYVDFMCDEQCAGKVSAHFKKQIRDAILNLEVMPSMRAMMTAGTALKKDNAAGFNCCYVALDDVRAFDEALYLLMCGCGVGFSSERQFVNQLPPVPCDLKDVDDVVTVADSKTGWAKSYRELLKFLYEGKIPKWDISKLRPAGAPLKTFGGRASGPGPLVDLFKFTIETFKIAADEGGRKLQSLECHDLMCKIGEVVVSGGVRRSALISLSNPSDDRMRHAKSGEWWKTDPQRSMANNSAAYTEKPDMDTFMREWLALFQSKAGERGIFNRQAIQKHAEKFGRRDPNYEFGLNPCGEIGLRSAGMCNLTEVVVKPDDDIDELRRKVKIATILGTLQASCTNFRYLRSIWKKNVEEEALLGVSLTGILDNELTSGRKGMDRLADALDQLRLYTREINAEWADKIGINRSAATTCVKPSGTVSQLVNTSSGIHPRFSHNFIRRVRVDKKDPLAQFMMEQGFPWADDVTQPEHHVVFEFPIAAPPNAVVSEDLKALDHLELWLAYRQHWTEHNPSATIYLREHEWLDAAAWVYRNFDEIGGLTFLPYSGHSYRQAPYEEIDEDTFKELEKKMPKTVDWTLLAEFEKEDHTISAKEYACTGDHCEVVDVITEVPRP